MFHTVHFQMQFSIYNLQAHTLMLFFFSFILMMCAVCSKDKQQQETNKEQKNNQAHTVDWKLLSIFRINKKNYVFIWKCCFLFYLCGNRMKVCSRWYTPSDKCSIWWSNSRIAYIFGATTHSVINELREKGKKKLYEQRMEKTHIRQNEKKIKIK